MISVCPSFGRRLKGGNNFVCFFGFPGSDLVSGFCQGPLLPLSSKFGDWIRAIHLLAGLRMQLQRAARAASLGISWTSVAFRGSSTQLAVGIGRCTLSSWRFPIFWLVAVVGWCWMLINAALKILLAGGEVHVWKCGDISPDDTKHTCKFGIMNCCMIPRHFWWTPATSYPDIFCLNDFSFCLDEMCWDLDTWNTMKYPQNHHPAFPSGTSRHPSFSLRLRDQSSTSAGDFALGRLHFDPWLRLQNPRALGPQKVQSAGHIGGRKCLELQFFGFSGNVQNVFVSKKTTFKMWFQQKPHVKFFQPIFCLTTFCCLFFNMLFCLFLWPKMVGPKSRWCWQDQGLGDDDAAAAGIRRGRRVGKNRYNKHGKRANPRCLIL